MGQGKYALKATEYLNYLCQVKPNRRTGSRGNNDAVQFIASVIGNFGYEMDVSPFSTLDYVSGRCGLSNKTGSFDILISPYSRECNISAEIVVVGNLEELENCDVRNKILLMRDEICAEQLMPKNFVFYNPEHHQRIYEVLEQKQPAGIVTATAKNPALAGALYPFPLIYDGDFNIPVAYCTDITGQMILQDVGEIFHLQIESTRIPAQTSNVIARKNAEYQERMIFTAHLDAYEDTPGALDNASGIVVLMLLSEMLDDFHGSLGIEIVAFNGEDHYSAGGEMDYLNRYGDQLSRAGLIVNIDGVGYRKGRSAYSCYDCAPEHEQMVEDTFDEFAGIIKGEPWYNGDHMIFVQKNVPAVAITSEFYEKLSKEISHTARDTPAIIDPDKLVEVAWALKTLVADYGQSYE